MRTRQASKLRAVLCGASHDRALREMDDDAVSDLQGNRIKKRGHPERSAARAKAGRHGVEGSRESWQDHQTRPNIVPAFHGILRLRDARHLRPPGIAPPQNDPVFF